MPKKQCPECKSEKVIPLHYEYIDDPDAIEQIKNGEFATGGCCIDENSPKWQCRDSSNEFGTVELL